MTFNPVLLAYVSFLHAHLICWAINLQSDSDSSDDDVDDQERHSEASDYKSLIAIHAGKPKGGLKEALKVEANKVRRLSLSEQSLEKATESHGTDVVRYLWLLIFSFKMPEIRFLMGM